MNSHPSVEVIELERAQIAHEIHDALLPLIVGAKAALESHLDSPTEAHADRERLQQAFVWLEQAATFGRELLSRTHPPELAQLDWTEAAKHTVHGFLDDRAVIDWQLEPECHDYAKPVAFAAYRIVIEAIRNAMIHAQATELTVRATDQKVTITNNGSGFDPQQVSEDRYGIRSMKGRAALVGGELSIRSQPSGPTSVIFDLVTHR